MSADLFDAENAEGEGLLLDMASSCYLHLTALSRPCNDDWLNIAHFGFSPDEAGFKNAENLISALQEWIRHTVEDYGIERLNPPITSP